jgi:hypothetical protein
MAADLGDDLIAKVVYTGEENPPKSVGVLNRKPVNH